MNQIQDVISRKNDSVIRSSVIYYQKPRKYIEGLCETLAKTIGLRDPYLLVHSLGVANFATKVARRLGLPQEQVELIRRGSLFHDIGKLGVHQDILSKPASLTPKEYEMVKNHPASGAVLLRECPDFHALTLIVRHHHEFFNGQGYPDKIAGDRIEIEARIISVAEAIDVMRSDNPFRQALSTQQIIIELQRCANTQFDPLVVEPAIQILKEMETEERTIRQTIPDQ